MAPAPFSSEAYDKYKQLKTIHVKTPAWEISQDGFFEVCPGELFCRAMRGDELCGQLATEHSNLRTHMKTHKSQAKVPSVHRGTPTNEGKLAKETFYVRFLRQQEDLEAELPVSVIKAPVKAGAKSAALVVEDESPDEEDAPPIKKLKLTPGRATPAAPAPAPVPATPSAAASPTPRRPATASGSSQKTFPKAIEWPTKTIKGVKTLNSTKAREMAGLKKKARCNGCAKEKSSKCPSPSDTCTVFQLFGRVLAPGMDDPDEEQGSE